MVGTTHNEIEYTENNVYGYPWFPSNLSQTKKRIDDDYSGKKTTWNVIFSVALLPYIDVSCVVNLAYVGLGLAILDEGNKVREDAAFFIYAASWDIGVRATVLLSRISEESRPPTLTFSGTSIAASMARYLEFGDPCYGFYELFLNGILLILYGGMGENAEGVLNSETGFKEFHLTKKGTSDVRDFDSLEIEPDAADGLTFARFREEPLARLIKMEEDDDTKMPARSSTPKSSKKRKIEESSEE